ncbi:MAG: hypothetical protein OXH84_07410 [Gammaproteobacteria bacterium]|nr:hypothetical protein [Gammaproteobacteria bacterium]
MTTSSSATCFDEFGYVDDGSMARAQEREYLDPQKTSNITRLVYVYEGISDLLMRYDVATSRKSYLRVLEREHLQDALLQIQTIEEQFEPGDIKPTESLLRNIEGLVHQIYEWMDLPVEISAMPEGDVTIHFSTQRNNLVFLDCAPDGTVYCMIKIDGKCTRKSYSDINSLPTQFISQNVKRIYRMRD